MKLIRTFAITSDEFWDYVEDGIVEEISKTTKKPFKKKNLVSGYRYENLDYKTKISIDKFEKGKIYQSTVRSLTDYIRVTYETEETKEGLKITFEEVTGDYDDHIDEKNKAYRTLHDWTTFGRMSNTLYDMRTAIINKRTGFKPKTFESVQDQRYGILRKYISKKLKNEEE